MIIPQIIKKILKIEFQDVQEDTFIKDLSKHSNLCDLKTLAENYDAKISSRVLIEALKKLSDSSSFEEFCDEDTSSHMELHLRTYIAVLERIYYSKIHITTNFQDMYNGLVIFAEIHYRLTKASQENFKYDKHKDSGNLENNQTYLCNYNIYFLLVHIRDTLHQMEYEDDPSSQFIR